MPLIFFYTKKIVLKKLLLPLFFAGNNSEQFGDLFASKSVQQTTTGY